MSGIRSICIAWIFSILILGCSAQAQDKNLLIDDFEGAITSETVDFGSGGLSSIEIEPSKDIVYHGSQSIKMKYSAKSDGYMWMARGYGLDVKGAAQWLIVPEDIDWSKYSALSFYLYGENSGAMIAVDLLDNGHEYWRFIIHDDFEGWKQIICPFDQIFPRGDWQPAKADANAELDFPIRAFQLEPRPKAEGTIYIDYVHLIEK